MGLLLAYYALLEVDFENLETTEIVTFAFYVKFKTQQIYKHHNKGNFTELDSCFDEILNSGDGDYVQVSDAFVSKENEDIDYNRNVHFVVS